jgi:hypothetical protein
MEEEEIRGLITSYYSSLF